MGKKLYKVTCRGMTYGLKPHGIGYVIASDPIEAYGKVRVSRSERNLGCPMDRELDKIELLTESADYPDCGTVLYE